MSQTLAHRTIKNSLYGFVSYVWPIAFTIFVTPFIIHRLGITAYGVYVLMLVITGFFSLLNFGIVYSFVQVLSKDKAREDKTEVSKIFGTTLVLFIFVGVLAILAGALIAEFGLGLFNINAELMAQARVIFYIAGVIGFIENLAVVYSHVPYALQRQDIGTNVYIVNIMLLNLAIIGALFLGAGLVTLAVLTAGSALFNLVAYYYYSRKLLPGIKPIWGLDKRVLRKIFGAGIFIYIHNASSTLLNQLDRVILTSILGPAAVTFYSLPSSISEKSRGVVISLSGILFPVTAQLKDKGEIERIRGIYQRAMKVIAVLAAAMTASIAFLGKDILLHWVGPEIAEVSTTALYWLAPTYFLLALFIPPTHFLLGLGKTKFLAMSTLTMTVLNVTLVWLMVPVWGVTGAAAAYLLSLAPLGFIFFYIERKFLEIKNSIVFYSELVLKIGATAMPFYLLCHYLFAPAIVNLLTLILVGPIAVISYIGLYRLFNFFNQEDWDLFKDFLGTILAKMRVLKV